MKRILSCAVALFFIFGTASCFPKKPSEVSSVQELPSSSEETTRQIIDQAGRTVTVNQEITRVVSAHYTATSLIVALGQQDKVVGLEMKAETRELYKRAAPKFLSLPGVGGNHSINVETVMALNPDLVILPLELKDFIEQFDKLQIPVLLISPQSVPEFLACVDMLGQALGAQERAQQYTAYYQQKIDEIKALTQNLTDKPGVYLAGQDSLLVTCTQNMYQNDLIEMAGGVNVSKELTQTDWTEITAERLVQYNPDYIFPVCYAAYDWKEDVKAPRFQGLSAVQNNHIASFPSALEAWDFPSASSLMGVLWLTNRLHPELLDTQRYVEEAQGFFKTFFGIEVSLEDLSVEAAASGAASAI